MRPAQSKHRMLGVTVLQVASQPWDECRDPNRLARAADAELAMGHVARAEFLAHRAEALRMEAGR